MKKTNANLITINAVFIMCLVVANVVTAKVVDTGISLFGTPVLIPGAVLTYAITFLCTDVIGEIWGKAEANKAVLRGFGVQSLALGLIVATQYFPAIDPDMQNSYEMLLGQTPVFVIGSMVAYLCSQSWDVWVFHKIRDKFNGEPSKRWIWNNLSTMTSQIIDTAIFITIAFGLGFGFSLDIVLGMIVGQYSVKFVLAALDTPFFYLLTRK